MAPFETTSPARGEVKLHQPRRDQTPSRIDHRLFQWARAPAEELLRFGRCVIVLVAEIWRHGRELAVEDAYEAQHEIGHFARRHLGGILAEFGAQDRC